MNHSTNHSENTPNVPAGWFDLAFHIPPEDVQLQILANNGTISDALAIYCNYTINPYLTDNVDLMFNKSKPYWIGEFLVEDVDIDYVVAWRYKFGIKKY